MNITNAVSDFGKTMGIDLALDSEGLAAFEMEQGDILSLEESGDDLLVYRVVAVPYASTQLLLNILKACNARLQEGLGWHLQVGLRGSGADSALVFLYRLSGSRLSGRGIEQAVDMMESFRRRCMA